MALTKLLTGTPPATYYKQLLIVDTGATGIIDTTLRQMGGGDGTETPLMLSTTDLQVGSAAYEPDAKIYFRDSAIFVHSDADGKLLLEADHTIRLNAATLIDINGGVFDLDSDGIISLNTTDTIGGIVIGTGTATVPISIGNATSEVTVNDNLNVTGQCKLATGGLYINATQVTSTAAELNYNDITTLGTSEASKVVTVNASGDLIIPDSDKFQFGTGLDMTLYHDGTNSYITNAVGALKIATETAGIVISIGNAISETTVNDNLTVTGLIIATGGINIQEGQRCIFDDDVDTFLVASADDILDIWAGAEAQVHFTNGAFYPDQDNDIDLGKAAQEFKDLYIDGIAYLDTVDIDAGAIDGTAIGAATPSIGAFTSLRVTGSTTFEGSIDVATNVVINGLLAFDGTPQALAPGAGAAGVINATTTVTQFRINGANALTISNGTIEGQIKIVYVTAETAGAGTLSGANFVGTSVTLDAVGSSIRLIWDNVNSLWYMAGAPNGGTYTA